MVSRRRHFACLLVISPVLESLTDLASVVIPACANGTDSAARAAVQTSVAPTAPSPAGRKLKDEITQQVITAYLGDLHKGAKIQKFGPDGKPLAAYAFFDFNS